MRSAGVVERTFPVGGRLDVRLSLGRSARPLTTLIRPEGVWRATRTPEGPATVLYEGGATSVRVRAWGPGATWAVDAAPRHVGAEDAGAASFAPQDALVRRLHRSHRGLRITRTEAVFEALLPTILEQKVVGLEARRSYRGIVRRFGEAPPGPAAVIPAQLRLAPAPAVLTSTPAWAFHRFGVEAKRADTIRLAARHAARLEECCTMTAAAASERLQALPGLGPWSAAEVAVVALGDADAVSVGDYHLPNLVAWRLAGEARADDARMLELLEPFGGHRARVIRLLELDGVRAPKFGPRMPLRDIAAS